MAENKGAENLKEKEKNSSAKDNSQTSTVALQAAQRAAQRAQDEKEAAEKVAHDAEEENTKLREQLAWLSASAANISAAPSSEMLGLQAQVEMLSRQMSSQTRGNKILFRSPVASDIQDDTVVFTARSVIYIVASYLNHLGLEVIPPFRLIVFAYAASDIRKEGREDTVKNFSQYSTNLKPEIDFLRGHPQYGITFSESTNEMMNEDVKDILFKSRASSQLTALSPEAVFDKAKEYNIPNFREKSAEALRKELVFAMAKDYKTDNDARQAEITKRRVLGNMVMNEQD